MPIYEYKCASCGHQQEFLQKVSDPPQTRCPSCGQDTLAKMVTAAGFQLKGSGWYATDFRNTGSKPASVAKPSGGGEARTEGAKSEGAKAAGAKTEAKAESKKDASGTATSGDSPKGG